MSTSYVPPGYNPGYPPPQRSGPGCWVWGFATCLVVLVIIGIISAVVVNQLAKSPAGRKFASSFGGAMRGAESSGQCTIKMKSVYDAVIRYHEHTGNYPAKLKDLTPQYLTDPTPLHCDVDDNKSPSHVTFVYTKPAEGAPGTTPILTYQWKYDFVMGDQKQMVVNTTTMLLNGSMTTDTSQNATYGSGTIVHTNTYPMSPMPVPPPPPPP